MSDSKEQPNRPPERIEALLRRLHWTVLRPLANRLGGEERSLFRGPGVEFDELREYQPGDDVRSIDWNVTARMNHPFIKKFVEERELTMLLLVDVSGSGLFSSVEKSKREYAGMIASALAFSAIRNNDKVGLILFSDHVEKFIPPRKGRRHVLRMILEILTYKPQRVGTNINTALEFALRILPHKSIVVLISDFLEGSGSSGKDWRQPPKGPGSLIEARAPSYANSLKHASKKHDLVAVHIVDKYELELPSIGYLVLEDAETGQICEVNTGSARNREGFSDRRKRDLKDLKRVFGGGQIDSIHLTVGDSFSVALTKFFEKRQRRLRHH